jgi:hypothetical protein
VPGFVTLLAFKFMFSYGGPVNQLITSGGGAVPSGKGETGGGTEKPGGAAGTFR